MYTFNSSLETINFKPSIQKPSIEEILEENILNFLFSNSIKINEKDLIKILNQISFEVLKSKNISIEIIEKYFLNSIKLGLENFNYNQHLSLLLHLTKINGVCEIFFFFF